MRVTACVCVRAGARSARMMIAWASMYLAGYTERNHPRDVDGYKSLLIRRVRKTVFRCRIKLCNFGNMRRRLSMKGYLM